MGEVSSKKNYTCHLVGISRTRLALTYLTLTYRHHDLKNIGVGEALPSKHTCHLSPRATDQAWWGRAELNESE